MTILTHELGSRLTFVLAMPMVPALPVALPDPRGELQRLVDHLALEILPVAGIFRWTEDGPGFTDLIFLGLRGKHFTITINRGARYRGGVCHSDGLTITAPDGSTRHYRLLMSKDALLKLIALLRVRVQAAQAERLRADLVALLEPWMGQPLASAIIPRIGGKIEQPGSQRSLLTITSEHFGTLVQPSRHEAYLDFVKGVKWTKRYGCTLTLPELDRLLTGVVAQHNARGVS